MFHTAGIDDPAERIEQARSLLALLIAGWSDQHEFGAIMRRQAERLLERSDETLFHDELAAVNEPVYFHEFVSHAASCGLQYSPRPTSSRCRRAFCPSRCRTSWSGSTT